jgi:hypothetical protein
VLGSGIYGGAGHIYDQGAWVNPEGAAAQGESWWILIWLFFRLFESRILVVVAEVKDNECWIITGYWEEQR